MQKDSISRCFLPYFFQILIFRVNSVVKGQKMAQNDKFFCLTHSISQETYITYIIWFLVHKCKMITPPNTCFVFSEFSFSGLLGGKKSKKWPKMTKNPVCLALYLWNCTSYDHGFQYTCVKWWYLQLFFKFFQNSGFSGY